METALVIVTSANAKERHAPMKHVLELLPEGMEKRFVYTRVDGKIMEESRLLEQAIKELAGKKLIIVAHSKGADASRQANLPENAVFINLSSAPDARFLDKTREEVEKTFGIRIEDSVFEGVERTRGNPKVPTLNLAVGHDPIAMANLWVNRKRENEETHIAPAGDEKPMDAHNWNSDRLKLFLQQKVLMFLKKHGLIEE
ncbi:hypothetical protein HZC09_01730 [Candidatus Micrarchaeota archaeon]|nr:hypothetical protein [Candidatus Micrarchaeota archaeon]